MQAPKALFTEYHLHRINPLDSFKELRGIGHSDNLPYLISRCKKLAEEAKGSDTILIFRVVQTRGKVVYLSHVYFDEVHHHDLREKLKEPIPF